MRAERSASRRAFPKKARSCSPRLTSEVSLLASAIPGRRADSVEDHACTFLPLLLVLSRLTSRLATWLRAGGGARPQDRLDGRQHRQHSVFGASVLASSAVLLQPDASVLRARKLPSIPVAATSDVKVESTTRWEHTAACPVSPGRNPPITLYYGCGHTVKSP